MSMAGYRVARRTGGEFPNTWGLWSDEHQRWVDVIYGTEREAADMLAHLIAGERRSGLPQPKEIR
jgi:hypothetical protein